MRHHASIIAIILVALAATILLAWGAILNPAQKGSPDSKGLATSYQLPATSPSITFIDPVRGPRDAKIKIVEFADFLCSACAGVQPALKEVLAAHPEVALVWKDLPDDRLHIDSVAIAEAAHCAAREGKFWDLHDALFAQQNGLTKDEALARATALGLGTAFRSCVENRETKAIVLRSIEEATALGIDATPYFFIGKERISGGARAAEFESAIKKATP